MHLRHAITKDISPDNQSRVTLLIRRCKFDPPPGTINRQSMFVDYLNSLVNQVNEHYAKKEKIVKELVDHVESEKFKK